MIIYTFASTNDSVMECNFCKEKGAEVISATMAWFPISYHQKCAENHTEACGDCGGVFPVLEMEMPYFHCDKWHCAECVKKHQH